MKIKNPEKRLLQFWGAVDKKHIKSFAPYLTGKNVLDMGCGLGTTTDYVSKMGFNCMGIDYDSDTIEICKKKYPASVYQTANAEKLPFDNAFFDTIILRDALHHFYGEADFEKVKQEILRVGKPDMRIIFFDPNVNFMLKTMRKISFHKDEECSYESALKTTNDMGFKVIHSSFNTLYSLPLSGGYVGVNFVPNSKLIQNTILTTENYLEKAINKLGLGRQLCWRYLIVGQKK
ncbi:MAG: class I SAM-dependent methyltransferase [Bacteroidia bacterium]|nr:class I SAM-dependent methyltransferase [Bacteroidia bacterium]